MEEWWSYVVPTAFWHAAMMRLLVSWSAHDEEGIAYWQAHVSELRVAVAELR
jgi:hypothetical protein